VTTELNAPDNHVQPAPLVEPRPMKKYTGNGQASLNRNPIGVVSDVFIPFYILISFLCLVEILKTSFTLFILQAYLF